MNPFTDEYMKQELEFLSLPDGEYGNVVVASQPIRGRCDDYLNVNYRCDDLPVPMLYVDGHLWMSMTYMEMESMWVPIQRAWGDVGTAGLGMGYFALRCASKEDVQSVTVYEREPHVIEFFEETFAGRPEMEKITIVEGDVQDTLKGCKHDFFFADIYPTLLCNQMIDDAILFQRNNEFGEYRFWTQEKAMISALAEFEMDVSLTMEDSQLISLFQDVEKSNMYQSMGGTEGYMEEILQAVGVIR